MNQYHELYDPNRKAILCADAIYRPCIYSDNPYITALPPKRTPAELIQDCTVYPGLPDKETFDKLSKDDKLGVIQKLRTARLYLPYYAAIETAIDRALIDSYERRISIPAEQVVGKYMWADKETPTRQHSEIIELSDAPSGFVLLGRSGCGKTTGINSVLRKYPKIIVHNPGTLQQHIQIPVLAVHMSENSNFHGLYRQIGNRIDKILGNTTPVYETELNRSRDTLSTKFSKLCQYIMLFNIGMLVVDEIELIDTKRTKEGTMETFMSLSNQTGIAVGVIGTEDAFEKLFFQPRTTRRLGELINADSYCSSKEHVKNILTTLYTYLPEPTPLTREAFEAFYSESSGIIAYLSKIFVYVAMEITRKPSAITPELIHKIAKKFLAGKQYMDGQLNRIIEDEDYSIATVRQITGSQEESFDFPEVPRDDHMPTILNIVKAAVRAFPGKQYTDAEIESALRTVIRDVPEENLQEIISATFIKLDKKKKKKTAPKRPIVDLHALKDSLTTFQEDDQ